MLLTRLFNVYDRYIQLKYENIKKKIKQKKTNDKNIG